MYTTQVNSTFLDLALWLASSEVISQVLVYTKTVDSVDGALWLAIQTPNIEQLFTEVEVSSGGYLPTLRWIIVSVYTAQAE